MKEVNNKLLLKMAHFFTEMTLELTPITIVSDHWRFISRNVGDITDVIKLF